MMSLILIGRMQYTFSVQVIRFIPALTRCIHCSLISLSAHAFLFIVGFSLGHAYWELCALGVLSGALLCDSCQRIKLLKHKLTYSCFVYLSK